MIYFYNPSKDYFIATNEKVLSSTLKSMSELMLVQRKKIFISYLKKKLLFIKNQPHYLFVRNPYKRIESFFKEKLREKVRNSTEHKNPYKLKLHQKIFYSYAGVNVKDGLEEKQRKLLNFTWLQFIESLPYVYQLDPHLKPQSKILVPKIKNFFPYPMKFDKVFKIDDVNHRREIESVLGLDLSVRKNQSPPNKEIIWNKKIFNIVNKLYKDDFEKLGYKMNHLN